MTFWEEEEMRDQRDRDRMSNMQDLVWRVVEENKKLKEQVKELKPWAYERAKSEFAHSKDAMDLYSRIVDGEFDVR